MASESSISIDTRNTSSCSTPSSRSSFNSPIFEHSQFDDFILVVGGLGYIGSHTSLELLKAGHNVIIIDNCSNATTDMLDKLLYLRDQVFQGKPSTPALDFYQVDYRDEARMREVLSEYEAYPMQYSLSSTPFKSRITGVIHFAGYKAVAESFERPLEYYANNVAGLIHFCSLLAQFKIKTFVFSSSATVYGELADQGGQLYEDQCDNRGCVGLTNPYGRTKWMCEAILKDLAFSDPTWTIFALRYFNPIACDESGILGENPRKPPSNLVPVVMKVMMGDRPVLDIFGTDYPTPDGTAIRDFIHVSDLAEGHVAAINVTKSNSCPKGYHVYNLGTGTGHSVREIVDTMSSVSGRSIAVNETNRREGDVGSSIANPSRAHDVLKWQTKRSLQQACTDVCRSLEVDAERHKVWTNPRIFVNDTSSD